MVIWSSIMPYYAVAFLSVCVFALVHLCANKIRLLSLPFQARFLSVGGGVAIAYVFIDLLPKLGDSDVMVRQWMMGFFPYFERHVYIMALAGFLLFFTVDRLPAYIRSEGVLWLSISSYALFNFLIGYSVVDKDDPEIQPLALFTFAIALHYFTNDYALSKSHGDLYGRREKWILIAALFLGWFCGLFFELSAIAVALVSAFIGGGVIMNVIRHELPEDNPNSLGAFLVACFSYTLILLLIGGRHAIEQWAST